MFMHQTYDDWLLVIGLSVCAITIWVTFRPSRAAREEKRLAEAAARQY